LTIALVRRYPHRLKSGERLEFAGFFSDGASRTRTGDLLGAVLVDEEAAAASAEIRVGSRVSIEPNDGEQMDVEISSVGGVSPESPLGKALLGAKVGDEVVVAAPQGEWRAKVTAVGR
jgi:transcription elongation GreA/GreB family factor